MTYSTIARHFCIFFIGITTWLSGFLWQMDPLWANTKKTLQKEQSKRSSVYKVIHFTVSRTKINHYLSNPMRASISTRLIPHFKQGKSSGIRLVSVRKRSLYDTLGLKSGDILTHINGKQIGVTSSVRVYSSISYKKEVHLRLIRFGKQRKHIYTITESSNQKRADTLKKQKIPSKYSQHNNHLKKLSGSSKKVIQEKSRQAIILAIKRREQRRKVLSAQIIQLKPQCYLFPHKVKEGLEKNRSRLTSCPLLAPYYHNGKISGFRMLYIKKYSLLEKIGVKRNDVILHINGHRFTSPKGALRSYTKLQQARRHTYMFLRNGKRKAITVVFSRETPCFGAIPIKPKSSLKPKPSNKGIPSTRHAAQRIISYYSLMLLVSKWIHGISKQLFSERQSDFQLTVGSGSLQGTLSFQNGQGILLFSGDIPNIRSLLQKGTALKIGNISFLPMGGRIRLEGKLTFPKSYLQQIKHAAKSKKAIVQLLRSKNPLKGYVRLELQHISLKKASVIVGSKTRISLPSIFIEKGKFKLFKTTQSLLLRGICSTDGNKCSLRGNFKRAKQMKKQFQARCKFTQKQHHELSKQPSFKQLIKTLSVKVKKGHHDFKIPIIFSKQTISRK